MKRRLGKIAAAFFVLVLATGAAMQAQAQTLTTLHSFSGTDGAIPQAALVQGTDGNFYGTTVGGGFNTCANFTLAGVSCGTAFKITPSGTLTTLYSFCSQSGCIDGANPLLAGLVQATDGNFYGTTYVGGAGLAQGTVFKITPSGTLTTLYSFDGTHGRTPAAGLVQATDGNFYGTTEVGGANDAGTVFKITPSGTLTTLHSFDGTDGRQPTRALIQATDGNFYGTTLVGGANSCIFSGVDFGCGTVFRITPTGTLTSLYSFCSQSGCTDGSKPLATLVQATDGNFYGTTAVGGANSCIISGVDVGCGTVFRITPTGTLTTLYSFCSQSGCTDGFVPNAGLVQATDGNFYGTTAEGGANLGTIFKITPTGTLTTLYSFCSQSGCTDGSIPEAELVQATDGNFYGTTIGGGASGHGTVFKLTVQTPAPTITSISPTSAIAGGVGFTLTVNGTNFVSGSTANFNGNALTTTFVSATQLAATVQASNIATAGTFNVTVTNPAPGGGTSNAVSFTVVTPQDATGAIINSVNALFSQGVINGGQDNSLVVQLQHAIGMMNAGKNNGAIGILESFISEVNDLLSSGVLSAPQAASLISAAESVIARL
jgi:uncharacterized repeat protein (TIGR03803 family)